MWIGENCTWLRLVNLAKIKALWINLEMWMACGLVDSGWLLDWMWIGLEITTFSGFVQFGYIFI